MQDNALNPQSAPDGSTTVAAKKSVGRPRDTSGKTALGAARLIFEANPGLTTSELREKLFAALNPKFNSSLSTCQTYVSLLRKEVRVATADASDGTADASDTTP